jgi:hypothetical protein
VSVLAPLLLLLFFSFAFSLALSLSLSLSLTHTQLLQLVDFEYQRDSNTKMLDVDFEKSLCRLCGAIKGGAGFGSAWGQSEGRQMIRGARIGMGRG